MKIKFSVDEIQKHRAIIFLIVLISTVVYANTFFNKFVWDDKYFIVENLEIRDLSNIPNFFTRGIMGVYRPIRTIFYALSYQVWGLNPPGYHLNALFVHILATILIYFIVDSILKKRIVSVVTTLLFATHPIHTESITFITTSFDEIGVVFFLTSFYLYIKTHEQQKNNWFYVSSVIFFILAAFTYEITLVLPFMIILYEFCFFQKRSLEKSKILYSLFLSCLHLSPHQVLYNRTRIACSCT